MHNLSPKKFAAPFFALHAPPGSRLVIRAHGYEYLLGFDTRPLRELVAQLGARIWGGGGISRYLVIEKMAAPVPRIIRVHSGHWGLIASVVPALLGVEVPPLIRATAMLLGGRKRVALVSSILNRLGYELTITSNTIRLRQVHSPEQRIAPPRGTPETLLALLYARLCGASEVTLENDGLQDADINELVYLLEVVGYHVSRRGNILVLVKSEPRGLVHSIDEYPEFAAPLVTHAGLVGDSTISGISVAMAEGLVSSGLESFITSLGGEAYIEENTRLRIARPVNKLLRETYSCRRIDPASCSLLVGTALSKGASIALNEAEKVVWLAPFLPQQLQELGVDIVVQK